jgi:hypothetical protein
MITGRVRRGVDGYALRVELDPLDAAVHGLRVGERILIEDGSELARGEVRRDPDGDLYVHTFAAGIDFDDVTVRRPRSAPQDRRR